MKKLIPLISIFFLVSLVSAIPNDASNKIDFEYETPINYSTIPTVNNSDYLDGYDSSDFWLNDGSSTATANWDIGSHTFKATNLTTKEAIYGISNLFFDTSAGDGIINWVGIGGFQKFSFNAPIETSKIDFGTNEISDKNLIGNWNFNSGNLSGIDNITSTGVSSLGNIILTATTKQIGQASNLDLIKFTDNDEVTINDNLKIAGILYTDNLMSTSGEVNFNDDNITTTGTGTFDTINITQGDYSIYSAIFDWTGLGTLDIIELVGEIGTLWVQDGLTIRGKNNNAKLTFFDSADAVDKMDSSLITYFPNTDELKFTDASGGYSFDENVTADTYFGDGSQLTGITGTDEELNLTLDPSLVSWWRLDDVSGTNVYDYMGMNNGIAIAGAEQVDGYLGKGYDVNATNYINITSYTNIPTGNSPRTLSIWVNSQTTTGAGTAGQVFGSWGGGNGEWFMINWENYAISVTFGGHRVSSPPTELSTNTWYHVVARVPDGSTDTNDPEIWINGVEQSLSVVGGSGYPHTLDTVITQFGIGGTDSYNGFIGILDDAMIFNRSLSEDEIIALYELGRLDNETAVDMIYAEEYVSSKSGIFNKLNSLIGYVRNLTVNTLEVDDLTIGDSITLTSGINLNLGSGSLSCDDVYATNLVDAYTLQSIDFYTDDAYVSNIYADKSYITTSDPDIEVLSPITLQRASNLLAYVPEEKKGISLFTDGDKLYAIKGDSYYEVPMTLIGKLPKPNVPIPETKPYYYFDKYDNTTKVMNKPIISTPYNLGDKIINTTTGVISVKEISGDLVE